MVPMWKLSGRLGNQMFQFAFMYSFAKDNGVDYYFQDPDWFEDYEEDIKVLFGQNIRPINQVAIHIRRGDYVNNPFYVQLWLTDYYDKAMAEFPDATFLVFSDDIKWCKERFVGERFEFSEGNDEVTDLNLMAGCKGIIMANSSFSWWAGFLSKGKVIAPKAWYADGAERTKCVSTWQRI